MIMISVCFGGGGGLEQPSLLWIHSNLLYKNFSNHVQKYRFCHPLFFTIIHSGVPLFSRCLQFHLHRQNCSLYRAYCKPLPSFSAYVLIVTHASLRIVEDWKLTLISNVELLKIGSLL